MHKGTESLERDVALPTAEGASVEEVAASAMATWRAIDSALAPIIGPAGVVALLRRSQSLVCRTHEWLGPTTPPPAPGGDFDALSSMLASRSAGDAARGHAALLRTFHELLVSLIGASLSERLLRPVGLPTSSGPAEQETAQ